MPELPEAETIVRGLRPAIVGRVVARTEVVHADVLREPKSVFAAKARGGRISAVDRRGKNVVVCLDADRVIAINLGMTGRLLPFVTTPSRAHKPGHPAVRFRFEGGGVLVFDDTRRFGTVECLSNAEWGERSGRMGPEPLGRGYSADDLFRALGRSRSPVRSWLLDQRRIAGVGNIYANEALFLAGVHPRTPARAIAADEAAALHRSLRRVLRAAIRAGGTTLRDYRTAEGVEGQYAPLLFVYGRDDQPCSQCGSPIHRIILSNRSAFFCPECQPERVA